MAYFCVLASTSPRRVDILREMGLDFITSAPEDNELDASVFSTERLPIINAKIKSESVADAFPESVVLGADTVVLLGDRLLGKPSTKNDAMEILMSLSGKTHTVVTGVCLTRRSDALSCVFAAKSNVSFKRFDVETARRYVEDVNVMDKAGAYAAQECGSVIIDRIEGSFTNVMGLPAEKLAEAFAAIRPLNAGERSDLHADTARKAKV